MHTMANGRTAVCAFVVFVTPSLVESITKQFTGVTYDLSKISQLCLKTLHESIHVVANTASFSAAVTY
jgi:hypothetical protein